MPSGIYERKPWSEERLLKHREVIRLNLLGKKRPPRSEEWCKKISIGNKGLKKPRTPEHQKKLSDSLRGKKLSPERCIQMSISISGERNHNFGKFGEKAPNWKGGKTRINKLIRECARYYDWRTSIFQRDNYTCVLCLINCDDLNADHIKPFAVLLHENSIKSVEDAIKCDALWDMSNGRTLCHECHKKTKTYGRNLAGILN